MAQNDDFEDSEEEMAIEAALDHYPSLKPLWKKIKKMNPGIKIDYSNDGLTECTITIPSADGKVKEGYFSDVDPNAAIFNVIRDIYSQVTGRKPSFDAKAYLNDVDIE